jgi:hypothetical protein
VDDKVKVEPLLKVINLIHDRLEGSANDEDLAEAISIAFSDGASSIWESTGNWLCKLAKNEPTFNEIWVQLSMSRQATVRFRVASFIDVISEEIVKEVYTILSQDKSKKVSEHAQGKWDFKYGKYGQVDIT